MSYLMVCKLISLRQNRQPLLYYFLPLPRRRQFQKAQIRQKPLLHFHRCHHHQFRQYLQLPNLRHHRLQHKLLKNQKELRQNHFRLYRHYFLILQSHLH